MRGFRHQIVEWKSTSERYIALLQSVDRFEPTSLHELQKGPHETWIIGRLKGSTGEDLYAIGLKRMAMDYAEARERARAAVERVNTLLDQGKDPFV